jgi:antitoxin component YwqK of YwqJK toxin-antitoxin module
VNWANGSISGNFEEFDQSGRKIRTGSYKNNLFTGHVLVYLQNGSSQKIYYQNGKIVIEKTNTEKPKQSNDKKL